MGSIVVYGGQGNIKISDFINFCNSDSGKKICQNVLEKDYASYELIEALRFQKKDLTDLHGSMLAPFLYNEWLSIKNDYSGVSHFSSHSSGILNVLSQSGSANFKDILIFIRERAELLYDINREEQLWLVIADSFDKLIEIIEKEEKFQVAIYTNQTSGVLAFTKENREILESLTRENDCKIRIKAINVMAPYHTKFLESADARYLELVTNLNIKQNFDYDYLYSVKSLEQELYTQWTNMFNWYEIQLKILNECHEIHDMSPNKFIQKHLKNIHKNVKFCK